MGRLVLILAALSGCYTPQLSDCATTCGASQLCPDGLSCVAGFCRTDGAGGACTSAGHPDAAKQIDASIDTPAAACPPVPVAQGCTLVGPQPVMPTCMVACAAQSGTQAQAFVVGTWHIASITSAAEQSAAITATNGQLAWIGLTQPANQTTPMMGWTFIGIPGPPTFAGWAGGQPDDANGVENNEQNCGALGPVGWGDEPCSDARPFVIEPF